MSNPVLVLQVFEVTPGEWAGRLLDHGVEDGRLAGCESLEEVVVIAIESGSGFDRIEKLDRVPPVNSLQLGTRVEDITAAFFEEETDE